jgi:hypothetical protein
LKFETVEDRVGKACQILRNVCENPDREKCSLYAELLAKKLRTLDENKREIVMHDTHNINNLNVPCQNAKSKLSVNSIAVFQSSRWSSLYCY